MHSMYLITWLDSHRAVCYALCSSREDANEHLKYMSENPTTLQPKSTPDVYLLRESEFKDGVDVTRQMVLQTVRTSWCINE